MPRLMPAIAACAAMAALSAPALDVGDKAPPLQVAKWVKNGPVSIASDGKTVQVVEFWATWCPPCRQSIPHLSDLQSKYKGKGLVVAGISKEDAATVETFVAKQQKMEYAVGVDDGGKTHKAWMAGEQGIPMAFIVGGDGTVLWKGHPMEMEPPLKQALDGKLSPEKASGAAELKKRLMSAARSGDRLKAAKIVDEMLKSDPGDMAALNMKVRLAMDKGEDGEDWGKALAVLDEYLGANPGQVGAWLMKMAILRSKGAPPAEVAACAEKAASLAEGKAERLNELAWDLMQNSEFGKAPLAVTLSIARQALDALPADAPPEKRVPILDTLARAHYMVCDLDKAIECQREAAVLAKGGEHASRVADTLAYYESARAARAAAPRKQK